jgi:hypothetical protein
MRPPDGVRSDRPQRHLQQCQGDIAAHVPGLMVGVRPADDDPEKFMT